MECQTALDRALSVLPERNVEQERLTVPDPSGETDGVFTRLTNLGEIADALSRTPAHLHSTIQRTLGTSGQLGGDRARYNGSFSINDFGEAIDDYVEEYVICSECGLPDTHLVTEDGADMPRCEACGAFRPVQKCSSVSNERQREAVEEGRTYEVEITGTDRKDDGVAQHEKYTIFVPGTQEGQTVRIYIKNTSGSFAFARLT